MTVAFLVKPKMSGNSLTSNTTNLSVPSSSFTCLQPQHLHQEHGEEARKSKAYNQMSNVHEPKDLPEGAYATHLPEVRFPATQNTGKQV